MIKIEVDTAKTVSQNYGYGDGKYENITKDSLGRVEFVDDSRTVKTLKTHFRYNGRDKEFMIKDLQRSANDIGIEQTIPMRFVFRPETADRILGYLGEDEIAKAVQFDFEGIKEAALTKNSRISMDVPSLGINSDWQVVSYEILQGLYQLSVKRYLASKYSYVASPSLPPSESLPELADLDNTPPDPVSSVIVTGSIITTEATDRIGILDVSWTPPNDGNYQNAEVFVKENGQPASSYKSQGSGFQNLEVRGLEANKAYDVLVVSMSPAGNPGLGIENLNTTTSTRTSAPSTANAPSVKRFGRSWHWTLDAVPSSSVKIKSYIWEIRTSGGSLVKTIRDAGTSISYGVDGTTSTTYKARVKAVNIYGQEAASFSGYSSSLSTEQWQQGHMGADSIGNLQLQTLSVKEANIDNLNVTNIKIGNQQVDEDKRINVFNTQTTLSSITILDNEKQTTLWSAGIGTAREVVASAAGRFNTASSNGIINSVYIEDITTIQVKVREEISNESGSTIANVSVTMEIWYW